MDRPFGSSSCILRRNRIESAPWEPMVSATVVATFLVRSSPKIIRAVILAESPSPCEQRFLTPLRPPTPRMPKMYPAHSVCRCRRHTECAGYIGLRVVVIDGEPEPPARVRSISSACVSGESPRLRVSPSRKEKRSLSSDLSIYHTMACGSEKAIPRSCSNLREFALVFVNFRKIASVFVKLR